MSNSLLTLIILIYASEDILKAKNIKSIATPLTKCVPNELYLAEHTHVRNTTMGGPGCTIAVNCLRVIIRCDHAGRPPSTLPNPVPMKCAHPAGKLRVITSTPSYTVYSTS